MKLGEQQAPLPKSFILRVMQARDGEIAGDEMERIMRWLSTLVQGLSAATLVREGQAVMYWEQGAVEPSFTLTDKGQKEVGNSNGASDRASFN